ncbi:hypothetical protein LMG28614_07082 [Paraburkholderia ultramafica]|uniref:Uncharacterized protein n=1 Tax=Paraburkholderia ultramafica TaxID=1544867 RepID=A0A6S7BZD0_9BURK|nr:hypothetical protein [Paraburkholderia ultramafica]CAB3809605.1 hypothetical protein LMG28614_07082 [Paraburkholderia ultramafica]
MEVKITINDGAATISPQMSGEGVVPFQAQAPASGAAWQGGVPEDLASKAAILGALNAGPAPSSFATSSPPGAPLPFIGGAIGELGHGPGIDETATESAGGAPGAGQFMETHTAVVSDAGGAI